MNGLKKRPEYKKISASLQPNEEVRSYGVAYIGSTDHTVVVTNNRILIVAEKIFTKHFDSIPFDNVQSLKLKNGMSGTFLTINNIKLRFRKQKEAETIYNMLTVSEGRGVNKIELKPTDKSIKSTNSKKISKPLVIFGAIVILFTLVIMNNNQYPKNTALETKNNNTIKTDQEIVDVIVFDQAKHEATLKEQAKPKYDLALAKPYQVINKRNTGFNNYHRGQIHIYADTNNENERIATLVKAAKDFKESDKYQYFQIFLNPYPTEMTAIGSMGSLTYDVQGKGVGNRDNNHPSMKISVAIGAITQAQDKALKAWNKHRAKFLEDGMVNDEKLEQYLIKQKILTKQEFGLLPVFFEANELIVFE